MGTKDECRQVMKTPTKLSGIATPEQMVARAATLLETMDIVVPYIKDYFANGTVYLYKGFEGEKVNPDSPLGKKLHEIEKEFGCKVYAVTFERYSWGRVYSFLLVSKYMEDWDVMFRLTGDPYKYIAYAYCWNLDRPECSEPGSVILESAIGGIRRVG